MIHERLGQIRSVWENLTQMFKERDAKLKEAGDLHRFLRDLDHFQTWLTKTPRRMLPLKTFLLLWRKLRSF